MPELVLHDRPIATVFDLLGQDENDMTASLGWALARNGALLGRFVEHIAPGVSLSEPPALELQKHDRADGGFTDIEIRKLSGYPAAQSSIDAPLVQAAIGVFNKWGATPQVSPRLAGSAPFYQFTDRLGLPLVFAGLGHGSGAHAPNEYIVITPKDGSPIAGLATIEKGYVDLLFALAGR